MKGARGNSGAEPTRLRWRLGRCSFGGHGGGGGAGGGDAVCWPCPSDRPCRAILRHFLTRMVPHRCATPLLRDGCSWDRGIRRHAPLTTQQSTKAPPYFFFWYTQGWLVLRDFGSAAARAAQRGAPSARSYPPNTHLRSVPPPRQAAPHVPPCQPGCPPPIREGACGWRCPSTPSVCRFHRPASPPARPIVSSLVPAASLRHVRHVGQIKRSVVPLHRPNALLDTRAPPVDHRTGTRPDWLRALQVTVTPAGLVAVKGRRRHGDHVADAVGRAGWRRDHLPGGDDGGARTPSDECANVGNGGAAADRRGRHDGRRRSCHEKGDRRGNDGHETKGHIGGWTGYVRLSGERHEERGGARRSATKERRDAIGNSRGLDGWGSGKEGRRRRSGPLRGRPF